MIVLNQQQEIIRNEAVNWFNNSSEQLFEISGAAGTGKSVLLNAIINSLGINNNEYLAMAFTGQAAIVMRTKGFPNARSIHSSLYEIVEKDIPDAKLAEKFGIKAKKKEFRLRRFLEPGIKLLVIDEAYMVPSNMAKDILSFGIKVLVCGDSHQLPPIGGNPAFLVSSKTHHLTQLMRQSLDNPIVYIANRAMRGEPIHNGAYGNDVLVINDTDFLPQMIGFADCVLCGTNKTRETMNNYIRELSGFKGSIPGFGERLICRKNNWDFSIDGISLANGLSGTIVSIPDPTKFDGKIFKIDFHF